MLHFDIQALRQVVAEVKANDCGLVFVKDEGIYLMSSIGERTESGSAKYLVYADGCNPQKDEAWYETSRMLVGGDDFQERLELGYDSIEQILSGDFELWMHVLHDRIHIHVAQVTWVPVAEYRQVTNRMQRLARVHYQACVGKAELRRWRESAIDLLGIASHIDCKRATPGDREEYQQQYQCLLHYADTVNAAGSIRYPAR
ncbi:Protein of uncharacterised function (DUF3085) [Serratia marcescens]|uniref:DUF3085 domain-containing protein n=1 Tax=Serratia marcescens TaxID=615 RepID=UPI00217BA5BE|nr:DUF3085 domain-containing protein [Serratia marcescens]CAI1831948.1 Protein of uncharacterised function (DUF3085) [Serratia marcescens]